MSNPRSRRNSLREFGRDYAAPGAYFVTLCTRERQSLFGQVADNEMRPNALGLAVERLWADLPNRFDNVDADIFQLMPNHIHAVVVLLEKPRTRSGRIGALGEIIRAFKSLATLEFRNKVGDSGAVLWHRGYHDRTVRGASELLEIREYVANNPVAWQFDHDNPAGDHSRADKWSARRADRAA
jgi:REP element-mobilizing transposase RayT